MQNIYCIRIKCKYLELQGVWELYTVKVTQTIVTYRMQEIQNRFCCSMSSVESIVLDDLLI